MFNNISWPSYGYAICILLLVYYSVIAVVFYPNDIVQFLSGKIGLIMRSVSSQGGSYTDEVINLTSKQSQSESHSLHERTVSSFEETDDLFQQMEQLTLQLKEAIATASRKKYIKGEFLLSLQLILKPYHFLQGSVNQEAFNSLILSECKKYSYHPLSAEEQVLLWNE